MEKQEKADREKKEMGWRIGELSSRNSVLEAKKGMTEENQQILDAVGKDGGEKKKSRVGDQVRSEEIIIQLLGILQNISEGKLWGEGAYLDFQDFKTFLTDKLEEIKNRLPGPL